MEAKLPLMDTDIRKTIADAIEEATNDDLQRPTETRRLSAHLNRKDCDALAVITMSAIARAGLTIARINDAHRA